MRSLKARLVGLWALSLLSSLVLGVVLVSLYHQSNEAKINQSQVMLARACDMIRDSYRFYAANWPGSLEGAADPVLPRDLATVLNMALIRQDGVEGGIWSAGAGSLAYAFPTYEGSGPKVDLPAAEAGLIATINAAALREEHGIDRAVATRTQTLLLAACPLEGPIPGLTGWAMSRVQITTGFQSLQGHLLLLGGLLLLTTALLGRTMLVWGRHMRGIEAALAAVGGTVRGAGPTDLPPIGRTGERELDRIVDALNQAGRHLAEARRDADAMAGRAARAERLAALGRVAAGMAHEIRNPIAAARLQGENALAGDDRRRREGIADMLAQLGRLDGLVSELLAMTQRVTPAPEPVGIAAFLQAVSARHAAAAAARGLALSVSCDEGAARFDPAVVGRILDNLATNAIRSAAPAGAVRLSGRRAPGLLVLAVADDGGGVPADIAERLFEPFVTGRADGTGLGLAIARELADAHGGRLLLRDPGGRGAATDFALELPQDMP